MRPLDRKLLRDLRRLWSQVITIAIVVACGTGGFIGSLSTHASLVWLRDSYYETGRFAHAFVRLKRAPQWISTSLRAIPGVIDVETTVSGAVLVFLPDVIESLSGEVIALPERGKPSMNRIFLKAGTWLEPDDDDGVLVSEAFAKARGLAPGGRITLLLNGRYEPMTIRGVVMSPEFIFAASPGGMSDDTRYGIYWLNRAKVEAAYDMQNAFNRVSVRLARGSSIPQVLAALDRLLEPFGTTGAYTRKDQSSDRTLTQEINEQRVFGTVLPAVFLGVALFLLNVLLSRHIATERSQIATLKALGYANSTLAVHYVKFVLSIVLLGIVIGMVLGVSLGRWMTGIYTHYFHFPYFRYVLPAWIPLVAVGTTLLAAVAAAVRAIGAAVSLPPAEAMRPPAPGVFRHTLLDRLGVMRWGTPQIRMIVRELERRPLRASMTTLGIACSVAIVISGAFWSDAFNNLIQTELELRERASFLVVLAEPQGSQVRNDVAHLPGVLALEGARVIPVRLRHGQYSYRTSIMGLPGDGRLRQVLDVRLRPLVLRDNEIAINDRLAAALRARRGDKVWIEPLEGERNPREAVIAGVAGDLMGMTAYMDQREASRLVGEGATSSLLRLQLDPREREAFYRRVREIPRLVGVGDKNLMIDHFRKTSGQTLLFFTGILSIFAACIAIGVVYNSARVTLAEHTRELATLRVMGFTRSEVSQILLGQLGAQMFVALPVGCALGYGLAAVIIELIHGEEFRIPLVILPSTYAFAILLMLGTGLASALIVRRRVDRLDLVGVLKTQE